MSVENALLQTAICTRAPISEGLSLCDYWAWLRYRPAISESSDYLRLRPEWNRIDPHQKTILSDELGMGFSSQLLIECLGFQLFADTIYVVKVVAPTEYSLGRTAKFGPAKSPDFIVTDIEGRVNVLECKGTQSSQEALLTAIGNGAEQKKNLSKLTAPQFKHKLVAGLFIPQWSNEEPPLIHVRDPDFGELSTLLSETSIDTLKMGVLQIALAKHLNLMGLDVWATLLATTPVSQLKEVSFPQIQSERGIEVTPDDVHMTVEHFLPRDITTQAGQSPAEIKFSMTLPRDIYELMVNAPNIHTALLSLDNQVRGKKWEFISQGSHSALQSPLGFTLSLDYL